MHPTEPSAIRSTLVRSCHLRVAALACLLLPTPAVAQDFEIADDMFRRDTTNEESHSPLDNLTMDIRHVAMGHLNRHRETTGWQHRGLEVHRMGAELRYEELRDSGWLVRASGRLRGYLPGGYEHDNGARPDHELWLDDLYLQRGTAEHTVTLGRQTVVWGNTIGNSVLDIINTTEYRDLTVIDREDARQRQWMVNWDWFHDSGTVSTFVNLYPEFNPLPVTGSPLEPELPWRLPTVRRDRPLFEAGTRWQRSFPGGDLALMAAWLYENDVSWRPPAPGQRNAEPLINDHLMLGMSGTRAIGRLLLTLDLAWSRDVLAPFDRASANRPLAPQYFPADRLAASAGLEYAITTTRQLSLSVAAERYIDPGVNDRTTLTSPASRTTGNLLLRFSESLRNDNLILSVTAQQALEGGLSLLNLGADWRASDHWTVAGQLVITRAAADSLWPGLDEDVRLGTTVTFSF